MNRSLAHALILATAVTAASAAVATDRWIHIRVDETGGERGHVDIQLPIELVSTILPAIGKDGDGPTIHIDAAHVDMADLKESWKALRGAKDGDYVSVSDDDADVRISKSGGFFKLVADDRGDKSRVRMTIPVAVVDAVLSGRDTIDMNALADALAKAPVGELLTVDDDESHVRIWIDSEAAPAKEKVR